MRLLLAHPEVAYRPCEACLKYAYDHTTGKLRRNPDGTPQLRPPGTKAPCETTVKAPRDVRQRICPKIAPDAGIELSGRNREALEHYLECRAVGQFPQDPIVARNARLIRAEYDAHDAAQLQKTILNAMVAGRS